MASLVLFVGGSDVWLRTRRGSPVHFSAVTTVVVIVDVAAAVGVAVITATTVVAATTTIAPATGAAAAPGLQLDVGTVVVEAGRGAGRPAAVLLGLRGGWLLRLWLGLWLWRRVLLLLRLLLGHGWVLLMQLLVVVLLHGGGRRRVGRPRTHVTLHNFVFGFTVLGRWLRPLYLHLKAVFVLRRLLLLLLLLRLLLLGPAGGRSAAAATGAAGR